MEYLPEANPDGSYMNESERNIHVWCSATKRCTKRGFTGKYTLGLVAGTVLYIWLSSDAFLIISKHQDALCIIIGCQHLFSTNGLI
jgi:hypothetical protein